MAGKCHRCVAALGVIVSQAVQVDDILKPHFAFLLTVARRASVQDLDENRIDLRVKALQPSIGLSSIAQVGQVEYPGCKERTMRGNDDVLFDVAPLLPLLPPLRLT